MKILTEWLRSYLPGLTATDAELAESLTLRGIAVEGVFDLTAQHGARSGSLFEMDITTNRVDAMNHYGIAREAAVIYGLHLAPLETTLQEVRTGNGFAVRVEAPEACGRFTARVLRGITIAASQGEVARRFGLLEQKQISNAVDATNYVTQAMGQPTHAFDLDKLEGALVVRRARAGERLKTLDGVDRVLDAEDLVVADERKALGLAGVMGGWDSMITPDTKNVLVEAAWFDPVAVRRMAKRHGLHTDASHRFERGADFAAAPAASALVSRLLLQQGGWVEGPLIDVQQESARARTEGRSQILLRMREVRRILGPVGAADGIAAEQVRGILNGLGCGVSGGLQKSAGADSIPVTDAVTNNLHPAEASPNLAGAREIELDRAPDSPVFAVTRPSWRLDLEREIDLLEEVARVYGYDKFLSTLPAFTGSVRELPSASPLRVIRRVLRGAGYSEAVGSTFLAADDAERFAPQAGTAVAMDNPLSAEAGMLRTSLVPGMLTMLGHNLHRGVEDAALFELGTIFTGTTASSGGRQDRLTGELPGRLANQPIERVIERVEERLSLAFGTTGKLQGRAVDFYTAKGIVESLAAQFTSRLLFFDCFLPEAGLMPRWLHPGRSARLVMDGATVGFLGQLHPEEAARRKLKQIVVLGEIRVDRLLALGLRQPLLRELSRFQPVRRDFSFLIPVHVAYGKVEAAVRALPIAELQRIEPVEVRSDVRPDVSRVTTSETPKCVAGGDYSLLLRTVFQSAERTLLDEELQTWAQAIQEAVAALGGRLRGQA
jgi:phenylalanyl-tRNA synthetase beta chain